MNNFTLKGLGEKIKEMYVNQDNYEMTRYLKEFLKGETYLGDFLNYIIYEGLGSTIAPVFYSISGPFDMVSKKAPQQAMVFQDGKLLLNLDYTHYADVRTGLMDALVVSSLGHTSMHEKKILYLGTGKVARESLRGIKEYYPEIIEVEYINKSGDPKEFGKVAEELGITLIHGSLDEIEKYDYIFCHTAASEPILTANYVDKIKHGAVITTFVGPGTEVADEYFNSGKANILTDWGDSLTAGKDLRNAVEKGLLKKEHITFLKDLFLNDMKQNPDVHYSIYRSTGTPMQNLAVLKLLIEDK